MNASQLKIQVSLIPLSRINGALHSLGLSPRVDKNLAIDAIIDCINAGAITIEQLRNTPGYFVKKEDVKESPGPETLITDTVIKIAQLGTKTQELEEKIAELAERKPRKVNVEGDVAKAVAKAFSAFRKDTPVEKIEQIAAALPKTVIAKAGNIFPACTYRSGDNIVDFSDLDVEVWGDQCPDVVDDYIFQPQHLHQALVALHDEGRLPDNVWLAGDRGTGKTEFVTQLAARLQRRLVRVNFDEALERADFIGGNTIQNGTVVWKGGVITEAIKHPGCIVLLDEVGFARSQSIAILHSLCERSPHRSLVIAETGERIPVAPDVVFFCADNSNGHGDTSGNFDGVREKNSAFIDRFSYTLRFDYLQQDDEIELIVSRTGISKSAASTLVKFASAARQKAQAGLLNQPPSLRQLFAFARAAKKGVPVENAFYSAVVNKFPSDCEAELVGVFASQIDVNKFKP